MSGDVQPVDGSSLQTFSNDEISVVCPNVTLLMVLKSTANQADHFLFQWSMASSLPLLRVNIFILVVPNVHFTNKPSVGNFVLKI